MINRLVLIFLMLLSSGIAQSWKVVKVDKITRSENGLYFYPQFSPDGNKLYYTTSKSKGLFSYDLKTQVQEILTKTEGAGYQPIITENGKKIYFKENSYINRKRHSMLVELDIEAKSENRINTGESKVTNPTLVNNSTLVFQAHPQLQALDLVSHQINNYIAPEKTIVFTENLDLYVHRNNITHKLQPLGEGHYIWASISPNQKYILFAVAGRGTYISDLDGTILHDLGYAHAPKWSPDGQWIVYMVDHDDGYQYTSSNIFISNLDGSQRFQITPADQIAMYPNWSPEGSRVTFHTDKGEIYLLSLLHERSGK